MSKNHKKHRSKDVKKHKLHLVHLLAVVVLAAYFFLSKVNFVVAIARENIFQSFLQLYLFGTFFAVLFLYIFSHEKFFPIAKELEKEEIKKEKKYLKRYLHHGKVLGTFIIAVVGGPVFASLTARILLNDYFFKYLLVMTANIFSTLFALEAARGIVQLVNL